LPRIDPWPVVEKQGRGKVTNLPPSPRGKWAGDKTSFSEETQWLVPKGLNSFVLSCHESRIQISCAGSQARGTLDTPSFFLNIVDDMIPARRYKSEDRLYRRGLSRLEMASNRVGCNGRREARRRTDKNKTKNQRLKQPIKVVSLAAVFSPSESSKVKEVRHLCSTPDVAPFVLRQPGRHSSRLTFHIPSSSEDPASRN